MKHELATVLALFSAAALAQAQSTHLVSVSTAGVQANQYCQEAWISGDGMRVAFRSGASTLVANDTNNADDVFVRDEATGTTVRASVATGGAQSDGYSSAPRISADGRFVAFLSGATNLVAGDANGTTDVFVHELASGVTTRVNVSSAGAEANGPSYAPSISADGRYVAYHSAATNLVAGDTNNAWDVFVHDRVNGTTTRASLSSTGLQVSSSSAAPSLSADGRYVAFHSNATTLVPGDTNGAWDIFVRDLQLGVTERVSLDGHGVQGNGHCADASISADGKRVAFTSSATNLVPQDLNGRDDVFVHDRVSGATTRVSVSSSGVAGDGTSKLARISGDGRAVAFQSQSINLDPLDFFTEWDVYVHDMVLGTTAVISVGAGGATNGTTSTAPAMSFDGRNVAFESYADDLVPGDLNNTEDIFVRRLGAVAPSVYCTSSTTLAGCTPSIGSSGTPSASAGSGFAITLAQVDGQRNARIVYGMNGPLATPWAAGSSSFLCVRPPLQRAPLTSTGGTPGACDGALNFDFLSYAASHPNALGAALNPGDTYFVQVWIHNPTAPKKSNLSDALTFALAP